MFVNSLTRSALLGVGLLAGSVPVLGFFPESLSHLSLFSTHQANESTDETSLALGRNVTAGRNVTGAPPLSAGAPTGFPPRTGIRKLECPAIEFRQVIFDFSQYPNNAIYERTPHRVELTSESFC